jgi:hypothetical protein
VSPSRLCSCCCHRSLVGVFAAVVIVALCRAKPEDVPAVWRSRSLSSAG